ncbi:hypothetical protein GCM10018966_073810 [Streptomyces yanii]
MRGLFGGLVQLLPAVATAFAPACVQQPGSARCAPLFRPLSGQYRVSFKVFRNGAAAPPWETSRALA